MSELHLTPLRVIPENIPGELKRKRQWVNWKFEMRDGKEKKVPKRPNGRNAESDNPATWSSFRTCLNAFVSGSQFKGIGFVFNYDYTGIDFDNCIDRLTGRIIDPFVEEWIGRCNSYTEYSQSGDGLHIILRGVKPGNKCVRTRDSVKIEMYDHGRFFIMTGDVYRRQE
jgi:putative DNA primase/helicase